MKYWGIPIMCVALMLSVVQHADANLNVEYIATAGFYAHDGVMAPLLGSVGSGNSVIAQLIISPDAIADSAFENDGSNPNYLDPGGNDVWLQTVTITEGATGVADNYGAFSAAVGSSYEGTYQAGWYIYSRIFDSTAPGVGNWYYATTPTLMIDHSEVAPIPPPDQYDMSTSIPVPQLNSAVQAIPEPATFVLALIGCIPFVVRFIRRRK